jgi:dTDP-4-amino-4,6-dideoxy-D-glucose acyltransferase
MNTFYSADELNSMGFKSVGENVLISYKASIYTPSSIEIGNNVRIDDFCILSGKIKLGSFIHISAFTAIYGSYSVEIDDFSGLSPRVTVFSASDDFSGESLIGPMLPDEFKNLQTGTVRIGKYVQVGSGSIVMPGVNLGEGAVVAAMSFVKGECKPWEIYGGVPAKFLKKRSEKAKDLACKFLKTLS